MKLFREWRHTFPYSGSPEPRPRIHEGQDFGFVGRFVHVSPISDPGLGDLYSAQEGLSQMGEYQRWYLEKIPSVGCDKGERYREQQERIRTPILSKKQGVDKVYYLDRKNRVFPRD
jgi:hypothetical protein